MLMNLRDRLSGWIAYTIVGLISIPFVLWGIGEYFQGGKDAPAATVNGQDISPRVFEQAYNQERQRMAQSFGGSLPPEMLEGMGIKRQVLDGLILREVLRQYAHNNGLRVSDAELAAMLRDIPAFQENGVFSQARYEQVLRMQGQNMTGFEADVRQDLVLEQIQRGIVLSAFDVQADADAFLRLREQSRTIEVYTLPAAPRRQAIKPEAAALEAYYADHKSDFRRPERVRLDMIELSVDTLAANMKPSEEDIRRAYEDFQAQTARNERREARHILLTPKDGGDMASVRQQADELRARLLKGESFEALAKEFSQDPGSAAQGGKLGLVERGMMVEPFEQALFALKSGELSEPVQTDFGWHLIRLDRIEQAQIKPLEAVRDQMLKDAARRLAEERFHDLAEQLSTLTYEQPDSLKPAAEQLGLTVVATDWVSRERGEGVVGEPKVRAAAFSPEVLQQGRNSELVNLEGNHAVVVRVTEHEQAADQPLEVVRAEVERRVIEQELVRAMDADAAKLRAALLQPGDAQATLSALGSQRGFSGQIKRSGGETVDPSIRRAAFSAGRPSGAPLAESVRLANGDMAVVRVTAVQDGNPETLDANERQAVMDELRQAVGMNELAAFIAHLRAKAEISQRQDL
ncbi:MAG: SurA N-terminal domain-containing protein [Pseudomonadota bacterium]